MPDALRDAWSRFLNLPAHDAGDELKSRHSLARAVFVLSFNLLPVRFYQRVLPLAIFATAMFLPALASALVQTAIGISLLLAQCDDVHILSLILQPPGFHVLTPRRILMVFPLLVRDISCLAALAVLFSDTVLSFSDAFFEAPSALQRQGPTRLTGFDDLFPDLLFGAGMPCNGWAGWLIVMAILCCPELRWGHACSLPRERTHGQNLHRALLPWRLLASTRDYLLRIMFFCFWVGARVSSDCPRQCICGDRRILLTMILDVLPLLKRCGTAS